MTKSIHNVIINSFYKKAPSSRAKSCHSEGLKKPEESPGKVTAYTPRRDDIQRLALMIYSHKRLTIYTASRDYGEKKKSITLSHRNKIRLSGFYFTFLWKISSTQWISPVKDGFHCVVLLRLRGSLDFAQDDDKEK